MYKCVKCNKELDYKFTFVRGIQKLNDNKISKKY